MMEGFAVKTILTGLRVYLLNNLRVDEGFISSLSAVDLLSDSDADSLRSSVSQGGDKALNGLMRHMEWDYDQKMLEKFCVFLDDYSKPTKPRLGEIAERIRQEMKNHKSDPSHQPDPQQQDGVPGPMATALKNKPDPSLEKNQLQSSEPTAQSSIPLSKECTDNNETQDSSSPKDPQMKHFYHILESTSCTPQTFEVGYRHIRKEGMTNIELSKEFWELVRVNRQANPLLKCVYFCLGVTSDPENLNYIVQTWIDLSQQLTRDKSFEIGRPFGLYLIAWTIYNCAQYSKLSTESSRWLRQQNIEISKDGAMELIDYCIRETDSISYFPLKPFFHITKLRWEFEKRRHMGDLDESVAKALLKGIDEVVQLCDSFESDQKWMKIDSFGARVSAINLKIEIAIWNGDAPKFVSLKEEARGNLNVVTKYFEKNCSVIPIYDEAWLYSVWSKFYRMIGEEEQAHDYAKRAAHLYKKCGRPWRAEEEDSKIIQSTCNAELETRPQCDISMLHY